MKRYIKISYTIPILLLVVALLSCVYFLTPIATRIEARASEYEERLYSNATIEDEFADDCIIVVMDKKSSAVNKPFADNKRASKAISALSKTSITDLTHADGDITSKKYFNKAEFHQIFKISLPTHSKENVLKAIEQYKDLDGALWVGPDYYDTPASLPVAVDGDNYSWGLNNARGSHVEDAWSITMGNKNVTVGVIDSGIAEHPDLNANLIAGWDFYNDNSTTTDDTSGHGTHVAGIIGATGQTVNGVVGVSPNVTLIPLQVLTPDGKFSTAAIAKAINWATEHDIDILNYSGSGEGETPAIKTALQNYKGLFVCAAGNDGVNIDVNKRYQADYSRGQSFSNRVITVGNMASNQGRYTSSSGGSNYGAQTVSIYAPGTSIPSTIPTGTGYGLKTGTSMASPLVAGVAALLLSVNPNLTASQLKTMIVDSADTITIDVGEVKKLNAYNAVLEAVDTLPRDFSSEVDFFQNSTTNSVTVNCPGCNNNYFVESATVNGDITLDFTLVQEGTNAKSNATHITNGYTYFNSTCFLNVTCEFDGGSYDYVLGYHKSLSSSNSSTGVHYSTVTATAEHCQDKSWTCNMCETTKSELACQGYSNRHVAVTDEKIDATCTTAGRTQGSHCSTCNYVFVAMQEIPALGHNYTSTTIEATCTESGYTVYECSRCHHEYTEVGAAVLGHNYELTSSTRAKGKITEVYTCVNCDDSYTKESDAGINVPVVITFAAATAFWSLSMGSSAVVTVRKGVKAKGKRRMAIFVVGLAVILAVGITLIVLL